MRPWAADSAAPLEQTAKQLSGDLGQKALRRLILGKGFAVHTFLVQPFARPLTITPDNWLGGSGNWNTVTSWSTGAMPNSNNDAFINTAASVVQLNVSDTINNLTIGSTNVLNLTNSHSLTIDGTTITNSNNTGAGGITLSSTGSSTELIIGSSAVTLMGGGTLTMSNGGNNVIKGAATADTLTNQETIQGSGSIGDGVMTLVNSGTINANQPVALTIAANGGTTNTGNLEATAGGTLGFSGTTVTNTNGIINTSGGAISASSSTINGGTVTLAGGSLKNSTISGATVTVAGSGNLQLNDGSIVSGTLNNSAAMEIVGDSYTNALGGTVTNAASGVIKIDDHAYLTLQAGTYTNAGTISMNSAGSTDAVTELVISAPNVTLSGGGTLTMSNDVYNYILGAATADTLTNQETIQGSGNIGDGLMGFVNDGTVLANQTTTLTIQPSSTGFTNNGTLQVNAGSTLDITGSAFINFISTTGTLTGGTYDVNGGTLQFTNANIVTNAADITLAGVFTLGPGRSFTTSGPGGGNFTNNGTLAIGAGDTFQVAGALSNFAGTTLTGGAYYVAGTLQFGASGSTLTTNDANLTLAGTGAQLLDLGGNNLLSGFNTNASGGTIQVNADAGGSRSCDHIGQVSGKIGKTEMRMCIVKNRHDKI